MGSSSVNPCIIAKRDILRKVILFDMLDYIVMVYSTYMNRKKIVQISISLLILFFSFANIYAAQANFSLYPSKGVVADTQDGFTVDVLIDSGGYDLSKARMVLSFDPTIVQLRKAMKNDTLFEQWPLDEGTTDNGNGVVMLTGYTPSGSTYDYYSTSSQPDVFARLEFNVVDSSAESITFDFEYSGRDELFQSVMLSADSSPSILLKSKPSSVTYSFEKESIPQTAINMNIVGMVLGLILILVGGYVRGSKGNLSSKKRGTVVMYE